MKVKQTGSKVVVVAKPYAVKWDNGQGETGIFEERFASENAADAFGEHWVVEQTGLIDEEMGEDFEGFSAETVLAPVKKLKKLTQLRDIVVSPSKRQQTQLIGGATFTPTKKDTVYHADVLPGDSIRIFGADYGKTFDLSFRLGEQAVYYTYNTDSLGKIVKITPNTVTIAEGNRVHRLTVYGFISKNHDFDLERILRRNREHMD
jgi:hypothetical protein